MPTRTDYYVITSRSFSSANKELIVMIPISEEEETKLDKGHLCCERGNIKFDIYASDIICYGEIDFSNNSDDLKVISTMNWLDHLSLHGICVPSDYNYEEHCCYSPIKTFRYYDTMNPAIVARYVHAYLGKPQRCCLFRERKKK